MKTKSNKGVQGNKIRFQPKKVDSLLATDSLIQEGVVIASGPKSKTKPGDVIIISDWLVEKNPRENDVVWFYTTDDNVWEIL